MVTPGFSIYSCFVGATRFFAVNHQTVDDDVVWSGERGVFLIVLFQRGISWACVLGFSVYGVHSC